MNNTAVPASPAAVWQTLLAYLLQQHYGLTLNDTEFSDERVIEACLSRGMSLCEALNTFAEKYALVRLTGATTASLRPIFAGTEGNRSENSPQQLCHPQTRYRIKKPVSAALHLISSFIPFSPVFICPLLSVILQEYYYDPFSFPLRQGEYHSS